MGNCYDVINVMYDRTHIGDGKFRTSHQSTMLVRWCMILSSSLNSLGTEQSQRAKLLDSGRDQAKVILVGQARTVGSGVFEKHGARMNGANLERAEDLQKMAKRGIVLVKAEGKASEVATA